MLLRHAKADRPTGPADFERSLTERGRRDSQVAGEWLRSQGYVPDLVVCSSARRARQTWKQANGTLDRTPPVRYEREVYDAAAPYDLIAVIRQVPIETQVLLVVGHNPTIEMLSADLDPDGGKPDGLRTASLAVHTVDGEWVDLDSGAAPLTATVTARA